MDVYWKVTSSYQAFTEPSLARVSLLSSWLVENASGFTLDETLLIVVDDDQRFCDFELTLDQRRRTDAFVQPSSLIAVDSDVKTSITSHAQLRWFHDDHHNLLQIAFQGRTVSRWLQLNEGRLALGLDATQALSVIHCADVVNDPTGALAEQWLQQFSGGDSRVSVTDAASKTGLKSS